MSNVASNNVMPVLLTTLYQENLEAGNTIDPLPGVLGALLAPDNTASGKMIQDVNAMGQVTSLRVSYKQPFESEDYSETFTCGEDAQINPWFEETFQPDSYIEHSFKISEAELRTYMMYWSEIVNLIPGFAQMGPAGIQSSLQGLIQRGTANVQLAGLRELGLDLTNEFRAFVDKYNSILLPKLIAGAGAWKGGNIGDSKTFVVQNKSDFANGGGGANADGIFQLEQEVNKLRRRGRKKVIHDYGAYDRIASKAPGAFGDSQQGINFSNVALLGDRYAGYIDENAGNAFDTVNSAVIFAPGSALLAQAPQYTRFGKIGIVERYTVPINSIPGLTADLTITPVACDEETGQGSYVIKMSANFGLFTMPLDLFKDSSPFVGTNGIVLAELTQAV